MVISIFLEDLERCSVCDPAQYNSMKKSQNMLIWLRKMVLNLPNGALFRVAGKGHSNTSNMQKRV
jgi:hypothetical protein